jgi:transcriptional regulator with XRE-family HTH domain
MATRETRHHRGRQAAEGLVRTLLRELIDRRKQAGVSQRALAAELGCSQSELWRLEHLVAIGRVSFVEVGELAAVLGLELGAGLHPDGDPIRDKGHQAVIGRFRKVLSPAFRVAAEVPLPNPGDQRSWDLLLRIDGQLAGVEAETRIRDIQALVRRIRQRERDGGTDILLLVLSNSAVNRRLVAELRTALGPSFATSPRLTLAALRSGKALAGSGVILI